MVTQSFPRSAVRLAPGPFPDARTTAPHCPPPLGTDPLPAPLRREAGPPDRTVLAGAAADGRLADHES